MQLKPLFLYLILITTSFIFHIEGSAQSSNTPRRGEFYFSWGYNTEWYSKSTLKINQPDLDNKYSFKKVKGHDRPGWDHGLFTKPLTIPQYNYRLGYFFNDKKNLGVEINFDHTKFIFSDGPVQILGKLNGRNVDSTVHFSNDGGFRYYLNNGANFLLFNLMKRWHWHSNTKETIKLDLIGKAGVGPVIPHVDNMFFGEANKPHFQLGGWNVGTEIAARATFYHHVYLEFAGKLDYARYSSLDIYKGNASHAFGTGEIILSLGYTFKTGKKR